ncbi:MAG: hypothetical protein ABIP19_11845, partial [Dermatophilaceae bacterium]
EAGAGQVDVLEPGAAQVLADEVGHPTSLQQDVFAAQRCRIRDGRRYIIKAADLPAVSEVRPADHASTHPLDRLSCTLGVLADIVVAERSRTTGIPGFDPLLDDGQVAPSWREYSP